jgi:hypothetical protein
MLNYEEVARIFTTLPDVGDTASDDPDFEGNNGEIANLGSDISLYCTNTLHTSTVKHWLDTWGVFDIPVLDNTRVTPEPRSSNPPTLQQVGSENLGPRTRSRVGS